MSSTYRVFGVLVGAARAEVVLLFREAATPDRKWVKDKRTAPSLLVQSGLEITATGNSGQKQPYKSSEKCLKDLANLSYPYQLKVYLRRPYRQHSIQAFDDCKFQLQKVWPACSQKTP